MTASKIITKEKIVNRIILDDNEFKIKDEAASSGSSDEIDIKSETELGQSLKELNKDVIEHKNMTSIELRSRLAYIETIGIVSYNFLIAVNFLPKQLLPLTQDKMRVNVSLEGKGREEIVDIVAGKRQQESPTGFWSRVTGMNREK